MVDGDIVLNKINTIERCLMRIQEEYENNPENLKNFTKQDSIIFSVRVRQALIWRCI